MNTLSNQGWAVDVVGWGAGQLGRGVVQQSRTGPGGGCGDVGWMFPLEVLDGVFWSWTYRPAFTPVLERGGAIFYMARDGEVDQ